MIGYLSVIMCFLFTFQDKNEFKNDADLKIRIIVDDTIMQKDDTIKYRYEVENVGRSTISFYPGYLFLNYTLDGRESLNNCFIDDKGEKLFYHYKMDAIKKRLSKGEIYKSDEILIDISKICWDSEEEINKLKLIISGNYFDMKRKHSTYTESKTIIFID